jgi:hypothetical protein
VVYLHPDTTKNSVELLVLETYASLCTGIELKKVEIQLHALNPLERLFQPADQPNDIHGHYPFVMYNHHFIQRHDILEFMKLLMNADGLLTQEHLQKSKYFITETQLLLGKDIVKNLRPKPYLSILQSYQDLFDERYLDLKSEVKFSSRIKALFDQLRIQLQAYSMGSIDATFCDSFTGQETLQVCHLDIVFYCHLKMILRSNLVFPVVIN